MTNLLDQLKTRRLALGYKQKDMPLLVGMTRQQYNRIETRGNPSLNTLQLLADGLNSQLMLIPKERLAEVKALLASENQPSQPKINLADDPWQGLLGEESKEEEN